MTPDAALPDTPAPGSGGTALRMLGLPVPIRVRTDQGGLPLELLVPRRGAQPLAARALAAQRPGAQARQDLRHWQVEAIEEVWRVAEEWWRARPVGRTYVRLLTDGGRPLTIYRDEVGIDGKPAWYMQRYATSEGVLLGDSALDGQRRGERAS